MDSDKKFTCNMIYVSIFASVKFKFNRLPGLTRYTVVAMLFIAMLMSLTSYTFFEQSNCASIECEMDVDLYEVDNTKFDGHFPLYLKFATVGWIPFHVETPIKILFCDQKQHFLSSIMDKRYLAFHSLKIFC